MHWVMDFGASRISANIDFLLRVAFIITDYLRAATLADRKREWCQAGVTPFL